MSRLLFGSALLLLAVTGSLAGCPNWLKSCGDACYTDDKYCCIGGALTQKQFCGQSGSTSGSNNGGGGGNNGGGGNPSSPGTADLRMINNCKSTLWFEARYGPKGAPLPGRSGTVTRADPGQHIDYTIPATGLPGTRFWAKYGCNDQGRDCRIGDQMQYWPQPPGGCPSHGCTPPVDSLFEATWGCKPGAGCHSSNPTTWFDTSQVDGWTIPYKVNASGATNGCDCNGGRCGFKGVDATRLQLSSCPSNEDMSNGGQWGSINTPAGNVNLRAVDLRILNQATREVLGCFSPCKKLNMGLGQNENSGPTMWMCCPTPNPNNCQLSQGCVTSEACRKGPVTRTKYVNTVHKLAPGIYSYSYDDGVGLHACPAGTVTYTMEFCPNGATYPQKF